jgi:hypothetical protein
VAVDPQAHGHFGGQSEPAPDLQGGLSERVEEGSDDGALHLNRGRPIVIMMKGVGFRQKRKRLVVKNRGRLCERGDEARVREHASANACRGSRLLATQIVEVVL